ncbi:DUF3833 domain-containing protein [Aquariibacter albus]|uniref:DUF3833 domain-containing protein n=1 Tax=Aquariibacter albus TaxID=2759899 RepID=A0A839HQN2_9BURK|nr:DUF3833 domain-containing protein [Aquariibacter albus]MBB1161898.1 DUF3833 domain-containing protein [Aquariibacter albus]
MNRTLPPAPDRRATLRCLGSLGLIGLGSLAGCASAPSPADHAAETPVLDLKRYFDGRVLAHGVFTDRGGKVKRRFVVTMDCRWDGPRGTLDERFAYSDGSTERRVWTVIDHGGGRYTGTAADVKGEAEGRAAGNALQWRYTLKLPVDGTVYEVQFDDWMYLIDDQVMLNKAVMSKFGIRLGEVTLAFHKPAAR